MGTGPDDGAEIEKPGDPQPSVQTPQAPVYRPSVAQASPEQAVSRGPSRNWGLTIAVIDGLMGLLALFGDWTADANGIDMIRVSEWFLDDSDALPRWIGLLGIMAIVGICAIGIGLVVSKLSSFNHPPLFGAMALGAIFIAFCPIASHLGYAYWLGPQSSLFQRCDVPWIFWLNDGSGLWLSMMGGLIALAGVIVLERPWDQRK